MNLVRIILVRERLSLPIYYCHWPWIVLDCLFCILLSLNHKFHLSSCPLNLWEDKANIPSLGSLNFIIFVCYEQCYCLINVFKWLEVKKLTFVIILPFGPVMSHRNWELCQFSMENFCTLFWPTYVLQNWGFCHFYNSNVNYCT